MTDPKSRPKVYGYTRVSTDDQAEIGLSLEDQGGRIVAYCDRAGLDLVAIKSDPGASGKSLAKRPAFGSILGAMDCARHGQRSGDPARIVGVVVTKLDRLTRSMRDWCRLLEDYFLPPTPLTLHVTTGSVELASAGGRLSATIQVLFGQFEREIIVERTQGALDLRRGRGARIGTVPYGYRVDGAGKIVAHLEEAAVTGIVQDLRARGWSLRAIARYLDDHFIATRTGRPWGKTSIAEIVSGATAAASRPADIDEPLPDRGDS